MKNQTTVIEDFVDKLISISQVSTVNGESLDVTIDHRMFCDLISIARCGVNTLNNKKQKVLLDAIESNCMNPPTQEDVNVVLMDINEYKKLINKGENDVSNN